MTVQQRTAKFMAANLCIWNTLTGFFYSIHMYSFISTHKTYKKSLLILLGAAWISLGSYCFQNGSKCCSLPFGGFGVISLIYLNLPLHIMIFPIEYQIFFQFNQGFSHIHSHILHLFAFFWSEIQNGGHFWSPLHWMSSAYKNANKWSTCE